MGDRWLQVQVAFAHTLKTLQSLAHGAACLPTAAAGQPSCSQLPQPPQKRWYEEKLGAHDGPGRRAVTEAYLQGLHWVLEYCEWATGQLLTANWLVNLIPISVKSALGASATAN